MILSSQGFRVHIGMMEKKMEATIEGLGLGLGFWRG